MIRLFISCVSLSFIIGCAVAYFFALPFTPVSIGIFLLSIAVFFLRNNARVVLILACLIALLCGVIRVIYTEQNTESTLVADNPGAVYVSGTIISDIEDRERHSRYIIRLDSEPPQQEGESTISQKYAEVKDKSSVLIYEPYPSECATGEKISFQGNLQEPKDFLTDSGRTFRYKNYLRQSGVYAIAFVEEVSCDGTPEQYKIFSFLRGKFVDAMRTILPLQEASLLGGLLLGLRGAMSVETLDMFRITGLIHIIVLSGYNITIVAEAVRRLSVRLPRFLSLALSLITVIVFVLLAGAQTAAVRAGSMASIALIARAARRENDGVRALLLVGALMVLYNPDQVLFSVSFHMSFLATLGLLICSPIIERNITFVPDRFQVRGIVAATFSTQVFLLPYLAYSIGEASIIGILANILVLPIVPIAMGLGALITVITLVIGTAASILTPIAYLPLFLIISIAKYLSLVPYAAVLLPEIPALIVIIVVSLLTYLCLSYLKKRGGDKESA